MTENQRLLFLMKNEKLNGSQFCDITGYNPKNLSNYLNNKVNHPNASLIVKVLEHFPHWNIRWWLLEEGDQHLADKQVVVQKEYTNDEEDAKKLIGIIDYMKRENEEKNRHNQQLQKEIDSMRKQIKGLESKIK